jgi:hypothetical protein
MTYVYMLVSLLCRSMAAVFAEGLPFAWQAACGFRA